MNKPLFALLLAACLASAASTETHPATQTTNFNGPVHIKTGSVLTIEAGGTVVNSGTATGFGSLDSDATFTADRTWNLNDFTLTFSNATISGEGSWSLGDVSAATLLVGGAEVALKNLPVITDTADHIFALADSGKILRENSSSPRSVAVPAFASVAFPVGSTLYAERTGTGSVTWVPGAMVTLIKASDRDYTIRATGEITSATKVDTNTWILSGSLTPASPSAIAATTLSATGDITMSSATKLKYNSVELLKADTALGNYFFGPTGNLTASAGNNIGLGANSALSALTSGAFNTGIGGGTLAGVTSGTQNIAVGYGALQSGNVLSSVAVGVNAGNAGATQLTAVGWQAGYAVTGLYNTIIGESATGGTLTSGAHNTLLGGDADVTSATSSYRTVIGAGASGTSDNTVTLGRGADTVMIPGNINVAGTVTLPANSLSGSSVTGGTFGSVNASNLTSIPAGQLTGTLAAARGGTGVSNAGTITLAGNLITTGAFNTTFAQAASVTITLPSTSATMARTDAAQTFLGTQTISGINNPFRITGTDSTSTVYVQVGNSNSSGVFYFGVENSTGNGLWPTGGLAKASGIGTGNATAFQLATNNVVRMNVGATGGVSIGSGTDPGATNFSVAGTSALAGAVIQGAKTTTYNNIATAGEGLVSIRKATRVTAQSAANASICTYTAPASDGSYEVSMNLNATAVTAMSASLNCDYTDESNTARTMIFPVQSLAGNFVTGGLITATGPYETPAMHIRCKASTAITLYTSAGTYTGVTYTAEGIIKQTQ